MSTVIDHGSPVTIGGVDHTGTLVRLDNREHRADCACGWEGDTFYGRGTAAREHHEHMREMRTKEDADGNGE